MICNKQDEINEKIVHTTEWIELDSYKEIEKRAGIYIFSDNNHEVVYIGKAGARRLVLENLKNFEKYPQ